MQYLILLDLFSISQTHAQYIHNHNHPLSLVSRNFRNLSFANITGSRPNYIQNSFHHLVTKQSQSDDTYEQIIEQPHTKNFQSQNNHFF